MTEQLNGRTLPDSWAWTKLDQLADISGGLTKNGKRAFLPCQMPYLRVANVYADKLVLEDIQVIGVNESEIERVLLKQHDLLIVEGNGSPDQVGRAAIWNGSITPCLHQNHLIKARFTNVTVVEYVRYWLLSTEGRDTVMRVASSTSGLYTLSLSKVSELAVPLAPLNEQHRIVAAIETQFTRLDAAVTALKRSQANLKRYRAAVLKAACEGRLVPTEAELAQAEGRSYEPASILLERILAERRRKWEAENPKKKYQEPVAPDTSALPELPEGWCWASIDYFITRITSGSRGWAKYYSDGGALFIRVGNFDRHSIRLNLTSTQFVDAPSGPEAQRTKVCVGDLLVTITADVGMVAVVDSIIHEFSNSYVNQHVALLHPVDSRFMNYVAWTISSEITQGQIREISYGMTKQGLNLEDVKSLAIPLPSLAEQRRIVAEVERRLSFIDQLERTLETNLARANRLRQSILKRAFAGQLVPQDPNDEPAAVLLERIQAAKHGQPVQAALVSLEL